MNLRNAPIDKRRLKVEDRQFNTSSRETAYKRAKQRRGQLAYADKQEMRSTEQAPGSGGFTQGRNIQQLRLREKGEKIRRSKSFRPEDPA